MGDDETKALLWLRDENVIQRDVHVERSGKKSVIEHDLSGGQAALIRILLSKDELSGELRAALAFALQPIGNSLRQLKKRLRRKPRRPSKSDTTRNIYDGIVVSGEIGAERGNPRAKPRLPAAGIEPKKLTMNDAVKKIAQEQKIGRTKALALRKKHPKTYSKALKHPTK